MRGTRGGMEGAEGRRGEFFGWWGVASLWWGIVEKVDVDIQILCRLCGSAGRNLLDWSGEVGI